MQKDYTFPVSAVPDAAVSNRAAYIFQKVIWQIFVNGLIWRGRNLYAHIAALCIIRREKKYFV